MNKNERRKLIVKIHDTVQYYCEGCFVYHQFRKDHSQNFAQQFCLQHCTVGKQLQEFGKVLNESE